MEPDVRYARSGGTAIAYQVVGEGDIDLAYVPDFVSNLVYCWQSPQWRRFYEALARSFRLILFDKRGTGLSDLGGHYPALETRMEDLHAVLDAAGSERTVHSARTTAARCRRCTPPRIPSARGRSCSSNPEARPEGRGYEEAERDLARLRELWGTQEYCDEILQDSCPTLLASDEDRLWFANFLRVGATPAVGYAPNRAWFETDIRELLPAVRVPTLVLYRPRMEQAARTVAG